MYCSIAVYIHAKKCSASPQVASLKTFLFNKMLTIYPETHSITPVTLVHAQFSVFFLCTRFHLSQLHIILHEIHYEMQDIWFFLVLLAVLISFNYVMEGGQESQIHFYISYGKFFSTKFWILIFVLSCHKDTVWRDKVILSFIKAVSYDF